MKQYPNIVLLCGPKGVGKSTLSQGIASRTPGNVLRLSFADPIRDIVQIAFGIYPNDVQDKEEPLHNGLSYRDLLISIAQHFRAIDPVVWAMAAIRQARARHPDYTIIFDDCRFQNEVDLMCAEFEEVVVVKLERSGISYEGTVTESEIRGEDYCLNLDRPIDENVRIIQNAFSS